MSAATLQDRAPQDRQQCQRCGTCCRKGGPSLHSEDRRLVEKGIIPLQRLFTIRQGEMARDNVRGGLAPVTSDHIKLKGREGTWSCCLYDHDRKACSLYRHRPLECRLLECWNSGPVEIVSGRDLLTRKDLLADVGGLWELVVDHQERCSYEKARDYMRQISAGAGGKARGGLLELIQYDIEIRRLVTGKGGLDAANLEFLFGRPMSATLKAEGLKLRPK